MKKRLFLSAAAFMLAIAGAAASNYSTSVLCYSRAIDVNTPGGEQEELCEIRESCDGGLFVCTVDFQVGTVTYTNVKLYSLAGPGDETTCTIECTRSEP
ncbi:DUF6520 family protein [Chitinophaga niabensis]|uniref:DUF6520 family protein n=1 Tax=Chitinophaga niabensis TaxID=536979 RepID=UPI0011611596|nr:DUF6520 family protein [Chitinophaga niabensis]